MRSRSAIARPSELFSNAALNRAASKTGVGSRSRSAFPMCPAFLLSGRWPKGHVAWGSETELGTIRLPCSRVLPIWNDYGDQSGNAEVQPSQESVTSLEVMRRGRGGESAGNLLIPLGK